MAIERTRARLEPIPTETLLQNIVASIAMQENALANVIDMEAEKMRSILGCSFCDPDILLRMNESVQSALDTMGQLESTLTEKFQSAMRCLEPDCAGGGGSVVYGDSTIPTVSIQVVRNEINGYGVGLKPPDLPLTYPYLRARIWGKTLPDDRVYLRRLSSARPRGRYNIMAYKRMAHPVNPPESNGGLPPHLPGVTNYWAGEGYFQYTTHADVAPNKLCLHDPANCIPTEWAIEKDQTIVDLFSLDLLRCSYTDYVRDASGIFSPYLNRRGSARSIIFDFVIARPDAKRKTVTFGPPSRMVHIAPFFDASDDFRFWGVKFS
ncbi:MAG: hypothetical protein LBH66_08955 [Oscillospiraceae bacterium]|jgi:hypothetical protein|nr:hypothetical protein [Oscillospiraceae bacterium]